MRVHLNLRPLAGYFGLVVAQLSLKRHLVVLPGLKRKRSQYDKKKKTAILESAAALGVHEAIRRAQNTPGYEKVDYRLVKRWKKQLGVPTPKMVGR